MNNKFKLPKIDILFQTITILKTLVLPSLFVIINLFRKVEWWIPVSVMGGILVLVAILAYFSWRSFSYVFEKDRIIIYSGKFQKKEKTIYYSRIHSVNIKQNIIHRILGLANLTIETPGVAVASADGEVRCLSYDKAKHLQHLLQRMGEASRQDEETKKLQLLHSIMLNMENSTSRDVIVNHDGSSIMPNESVEQTESNIAIKNISSSNPVFEQSTLSNIEANEQKKADLNLTLNSNLMIKSALTSLNINIVLVWFAGIFAFADDIFNTFFPNSTLFDDLLSQFNFSKNIVIFIVVVLIGAIFMTWVLSVFFYFIKFFDYKLERKGKQISVSYGLFNRQSIVFNETKVQSLVFDENPLRQMIGYGELKVNIVRTVQENQTDNSYIVIHPFIKKGEIGQYLEHLMPKCNIAKHDNTESLPMKSLYTYLLVPMIISVIPTLATVYWFHFKALWFLIFPIIVFVMRYIQFKSAAFSIDGKELKLVTRRFSKYTVYVRRQKIISLEQKSSPYQHKHHLGKISVRTLGGILAKNYDLNGVKEEHINQTRTWLQTYIKK